MRVLQLKDILHFPMEDGTLTAFEVPFVEGSTNTTTPNSEDASDSNPSEALCDEVLKIINAHLSKEGFDQQTGLTVKRSSFNKHLYIRVPSGFLELNPTNQLQQKLDLYLCFQLFTIKNHWFCEKCKKTRQVPKQFEFWRLPDVLIIHLKRFGTTLPMTKVNELVDFPEEGLKICNSKQQESIYDLVAVSNHMGGPADGHYTAYAKNRYDNRWYNFDDSYTYPLSGNPVVRPLSFDPCCSLDCICNFNNSSVDSKLYGVSIKQNTKLSF
ncbi:unnamed protein product [Dibothriocephalus latus]|uniref:ubiquitinyl hydrolase 1 n=1 Tax=Dibothriocephalus latus TaxID=60516 RepID=A0A3P7N8E9_DIBLA|nr:unnamed protein product [Dibothriocephalus latus]